MRREERFAAAGAYLPAKDFSFQITNGSQRPAACPDLNSIQGNRTTAESVQSRCIQPRQARPGGRRRDVLFHAGAFEQVLLTVRRYDSPTRINQCPSHLPRIGAAIQGSSGRERISDRRPPTTLYARLKAQAAAFYRSLVMLHSAVRACQVVPVFLAGMPEALKPGRVVLCDGRYSTTGELHLHEAAWKTKRSHSGLRRVDAP